ncbi:YqeG family HAD IIIA-type phosphatase [Halalkalibacter urbisdiaboli]|uniref:YqeG family HAD IIIA-type phosphatase n=1 Tax=Halalkalibacter urbisdiaboli TaxID=1960589 RepID=UPI000B4444E2|nr:HAD-IIIA family hydrolase [Halalkalibacter urbisdiaboli]
MKYFKPDFELQHFSEITATWLQQNNIRTIFSDLDSTLAVHDQHGDEDVEKWVEILKKENVQLVIASNNSQERVDRFCKPFGIIGFGKCNKPSPHRVNQHMKDLQAQPETSLFLGDQLLTDIWCGKRLSIRTALVHPIGQEHEPIQIVLKRKIEAWIKKRW